MSGEDRHQDVWALPTLCLWFVFFFIGLFPDLVFSALRSIGGVVTMNAYINNPDVITIAFTLYLGVFSFLRARESGLNDAQAQGRAIQVGIFSIVAFLWQPLGLLGLTGDMLHSGWWQARFLVLLIFATAFLKMLAWLYLLSLVVRYYGFGNHRVFAEMFCFFPSAAVEPAAEEPNKGDADEWDVQPRNESSE